MLHKASKQAFVLFTIMINWLFLLTEMRSDGEDEESCPCQWNKGEKFLIGTFIVYYGSRKVFGSRSTLAFKYIFHVWFMRSNFGCDFCSLLWHSIWVFVFSFFLSVEKQKRDFLCALRCEFTLDSNLNNRNGKTLSKRHGIWRNVMRLKAITHFTPTCSHGNLNTINQKHKEPLHPS